MRLEAAGVRAYSTPLERSTRIREAAQAARESMKRARRREVDERETVVHRPASARRRHRESVSDVAVDGVRVAALYDKSRSVTP